MKASEADDPVRWWLAGDSPDEVLARLDQMATGDGASDRSDPSGGQESTAGSNGVKGPGATGNGQHTRTGSTADAAGASATVVGSGPVRLGIVEPDERKIRLARRLMAKGEAWHGRGDIWFTPRVLVGREDGPGGKVAFLFPGVEPAFTAGEIDLPALGLRFGLEAPVMTAETVPHQTASIYRLGNFLELILERLDIYPDMAAGHSIGEWSGYVASGIVPRERANALLETLSGDLGSIPLPEVDFAALSSGVDAIRDVVDGIDGVDVSHDNSPHQSIICGPPELIDQALERLRDAHVLGYKLPFRSGFHTPAIAPLIEHVRAHVDALPLVDSDFPMWSATTVAPYPKHRAEIMDLVLRHLVEPVRFGPMIERLYHEAGARIFLQVGIGSLTAFVEDTLGDAEHLAVPLLVGKRSALAQMHRALTALWVTGMDISPDALTDHPPQADPLSGAEPAPARAAAPEPSPPSAASPEPEPAHASGPQRQPEPPTEAPAQPQPAAPAPEPEPVLAAADAAGPSSSALTAPATGVAASTPSNGTNTVSAPAGSPAPAGPDPSSVPSAHPLTAAADTLAIAARATQEVLDALAVRLAATAQPSTQPAPAPARKAPLAKPPESPEDQEEPEPEVPRLAAPPEGWPTGKTTFTRHMSLENMPETLDHRLIDQPEGWPDPSDGFPIVAMTTQIQVLQDIAEEFSGGLPVVEISDVRNYRWLDLSDPQDVPVTVIPKGTDVLNIALGGYCRANLRVGQYRRAPRHKELQLTGERPTRYTARELLDLLMFHGPRFHGVTSMGPIGNEGMIGDFEHLDTPGSLLDNLGKLIAYWVIDNRGLGEGALPIGIKRIELFGPNPPPGTPVRCEIHVLELQRDLARADGVLVLPDGRVLGKIESWSSMIFHLDEKIEPVYHNPGGERSTDAQPGGWHLGHERWPTGPGRELTLRRFARRDERAVYAQLNLLEQRRWTVDLVTAKDAVRQWLWDTYQTPCYATEVYLVPDGDHRFRAESPHIPEGHDLRLTLSTMEWLAVVIVGDGAYRDIEALDVPEGADPEDVARQAVEAVASRNPGAQVDHVTEPQNITRSWGEIPGPHIAVAWTRDGSRPARSSGSSL